MPMTVTNKIDTLKKVFVGVSEFRFKNRSEKLTASTTWDYELPILRDSVSFDNPAPTFNRVYIHGDERPYATTAEPSDMTLTFEIPSISDRVTGWLYNDGGTVEGIADTIDSVSGNWAGKGIKLDNKVIEGMAMIISEDRKHALVIKNLKCYSSVNMDDLSTSPVSFTITATLEGGVSTDTDGDIVFLDFTAGGA